MSKTETPDNTSKQKLKIKYEETSAHYANQFLVNTTNEELFLDLSSGSITDPNTGEAIVPIHSRIAMSYSGARRLANILTQAVQRHEATQASSSKPAATDASARLPKVD